MSVLCQESLSHSPSEQSTSLHSSSHKPADSPPLASPSVPLVSPLVDVDVVHVLTGPSPYTLNKTQPTAAFFHMSASTCPPVHTPSQREGYTTPEACISAMSSPDTGQGYDTPGQIHTPLRIPLLTSPSANREQARSRQAPDSLLLIHGHIDGWSATLMVDSGASHNFVSTTFAQRHQLATSASPLTAVRMGDGKSVSAPGQQVRAKKLSLTGQTDLSTGHSSAVTYSNVAFHLVTLAPYCDAVLGMDFFNQARLQLDYQVSALGHHTCTGLTVHPDRKSVV